MNKRQQKNVLRWVKALMSGDYQQGKKQLFNYKTGCHDALGVMLEEFGFAKFGEHYFFGFDADRNSTLFSSKVVPEKWFARTFGTEIEPACVVNLNDLAGCSFNTIAYYYLLSFLPESVEKADLSRKLMHEIKTQARNWEEKNTGLPNPSVTATVVAFRKNLETDWGNPVGREEW